MGGVGESGSECGGRTWLHVLMSLVRASWLGGRSEYHVVLNHFCRPPGDCRNITFPEDYVATSMEMRGM